MRFRCARTPRAVQPSSWVCLRLGAVRYGYVGGCSGLLRCLQLGNRKMRLWGALSQEVLCLRYVLRRTRSGSLWFAGVTAFAHCLLTAGTSRGAHKSIRRCSGAIEEFLSGWLACTHHKEARRTACLTQRRRLIKFHRVQPS